jgi:hypothetical protein
MHIYVAKVIFGLRMYDRIAVNLGCRGLQDSSRTRFARPSMLIMPITFVLTVLIDCTVMDRRCRACKVIYLIDLEQDRFGDIVPDQLKMMVVEQDSRYSPCGREEIIETNNVVALREQSFTKMRANKPGTAVTRILILMAIATVLVHNLRAIFGYFFY